MAHACRAYSRMFTSTLTSSRANNHDPPLLQTHTVNVMSSSTVRRFNNILSCVITVGGGVQWWISGDLSVFCYGKMAMVGPHEQGGKGQVALAHLCVWISRLWYIAIVPNFRHFCILLKMPVCFLFFFYYNPAGTDNLHNIFIK